jgi:hypothetical protein
MDRELHSETFFLPSGTFQVSPGSVVGIAANLRAGRSGVPISVRVRNFSVILSIQTGSRAQPTLPLNGHRAYFPGLRRPQREFNYSILYRGEE